jgi:NAD(P)-dependent dehydrogenase (short-subunit alcohol dehydrogenase family)
MVKQKRPVWFITGCSRGFGRELAKAALVHGCSVVVTARDPKKVEDIAAGKKDQALVLKLDVNNSADVVEVVKKAEATFGGIDVLVNNAGYGYLGAIEECEENEIRAMFETNFFGISHMIQAVLPGMRKRRTGHIVNISSIGGLVGSPSAGYYNATKFALEGLSEALAKEVEPLGIKVLIVEPGPFRTDWAGRSLKQARQEIPDYAQTAGSRRKLISSYSGTQPGDPKRAADAIIKTVESNAPPLRLLLGQMAIDTARAKLDAMRRDFDTWESVTLSADFPKEPSPLIK